MREEAGVTERAGENSPPTRSGGGAWLWVRILLVGFLVAFGLWQGHQASLRIKRAKAASYGLVDNSGRTAVVSFWNPLLAENSPRLKVLLVYEGDYPRYSPKAREMGLPLLVYLGGPERRWVVLRSPYRHVVFLSGDGVVLASRSCPEGEGACRKTFPLPFSAFIESPVPTGAELGSQLRLLAYGDWLDSRR